jgi:hypothetical protein
MRDVEERGRIVHSLVVRTLDTPTRLSETHASGRACSTDSANETHPITSFA